MTATATAPSDTFELLVRDGERLDAQILEPNHRRETLQHLLGWSLAGALAYGAGAGLAMELGDAGGPDFFLGPHPALVFPLALAAAFLVSLFVCLPSFYFYTQLAGYDASFRLVTAQALRVQAHTSVLLLGFLPIYACVTLGVLITQADTGWLLVIGLVGPFVIGLWGLRALYRSFGRLGATLPQGHKTRTRMLRRMTLAWGAVYTAVCPVALYRIGEWLASLA